MKISQIEQRYQERMLIKKETRKTILVAVVLLVSVGLLTAAAYFVNTEMTMEKRELEDLTGMLSIISIVMVVTVMGVRRSIYYSPRLIQDGATLSEALRKWRIIDIVLMALAEAIPIMGLVVAVLGMPFNRIFHFFVAGGALMFILMPLPIKVKGKVSILKKHHPDMEIV